EPRVGPARADLLEVPPGARPDLDEAVPARVLAEPGNRAITAEEVILPREIVEVPRQAIIAIQEIAVRLKAGRTGGARRLGVGGCGSGGGRRHQWTIR